MLAFTPDVSAAPATSGVASAARSLLGQFLSSPRSAPAPLATTDLQVRTVPNLAAGTAFMAWRS